MSKENLVKEIFEAIGKLSDDERARLIYTLVEVELEELKTEWAVGEFEGIDKAVYFTGHGAEIVGKCLRKFDGDKFIKVLEEFLEEIGGK